MTSTLEVSAPAWWTDTEALMAAADPSFAHRPQQAQAAGIVDEALRSRAHAALDLPTGSGKTLISLAAAEHAKGRTVISTATKALQAQIRDKDEPALRAAGVLTRDVVILEGRSNYACRNRLEHELGRTNQPAAKKVLRMVLKHLKKTPELSRRDQIPTGIPDWIWSKISSDSDACTALKCQTSTACAYTQLRNQARTAPIVVVNHSLLLADAQIKGGDPVNWGLKSPDTDAGEKAKPAVLGPYQHLIVDEAHALEAAAEGFGENRVTIRGIQALATRISRHEDSGSATRHMATCLDELRTSMLGLPAGALLAATGRDDPIFTPSADAAREAGKALRARHSSFEGDVATEILVAACYALARKLDAIDLALRTGRDEIGIRAVSAEVAPGAIDPTGIKSQLVDASPWLIGNLFTWVPTIAMSGTLAVPGRRDWVATRIGLDAKVEVLPTSFNLREQRLVYVTPRVEDKAAASQARVTDADVRELEELIESSGGRALVLFPAISDMRYVKDRLKISHTLLAQGLTIDGESPKGDPVPASNAKLAALFTEDTSSCLLATKSFMEGVDFPGATCSLVVVVRFPNLRPNDPLVMARRQEIERRGGNPWVEYQEPSMQLVFRQAAGRAIRRVDDRGVVAVLDPRCQSKNYAKTALRSLAPSDYTDQLSQVRDFLA